MSALILLLVLVIGWSAAWLFNSTNFSADPVKNLRIKRALVAVALIISTWLVFFRNVTINT